MAYSSAPSSSSSSSGLSSTTRVMNELSNYRKEPNPALESLGPVSEDDLFHWNAVLKGPEGTPYEGGRWKIDIRIPENYPHKAPEMKFLTSICHPNIHLKTGEICLDLLKHNWSAACSISMTLTSVQQLLTSPEEDSPLNVDAALVIRAGDKVGYESLVRVWSLLHAGKPPTLG
ncbi:ubiquitin-conjugating enzyme [Choiromyces venosus 120613-1]|uniref:Ubiquitin-conjugating enzyme n=1 Tax=Choiromyces venosus 120613-1 TaxID=1336337 RepID=A0A3N4J8V6_9PEZI|nr:ubiquitin-conjugating enzyme [Choiromyces venosus 120613-1]